MKKVKRIIAGMAAAVMAFSTMSIGASAATWSVYFSTSGIPHMSDSKTFTPTNTITYFYENCTSFNQTPDLIGKVAYVKYRASKRTSNGVFIEYCMSEYYHYNTQNIHQINLSSSISSGYKLQVDYNLVGNGNNSSMSGDVYA